MANVFKLKQSSVAGKTPAVGQMTLGEIAVNTTDGKLFTKKNVSGTETVESFSPDSVVNAALAALTNRATNEVVTGNWTFPGEKYQSGAASELNFTAPFNGTSIPNGYLKLVTPIKASDYQMFSIDVVGYDYNAGKSIDFTVVGYAYAGTNTIINIGFSNRSSFSRDVRLVLEARDGGERVMVLALGAETAPGVSNQAWYFQKLSVKVRLWAGLYATATVSDFSWVAGETTLSAGYFSSTNLNNLTMDGQLGTIVAGGAITASNLSGVNTGDQTNIAGNAGTATKLQTARTINGVAFDGTANITIADATKTPLAGTGASGTWGISITGNAATATNATNAATAPWAGISGKPSVIAAGADMAGARASIEAVAVDEVITPFITVSSTSQPAVDGVQYGLANAAATTLTLPPDPEVGSLVFVVVLNGRSDNILGRSGSLIGGLTENMTINNPKRPFAAKFVGGTTGWVIL